MNRRLGTAIFCFLVLLAACAPDSSRREPPPAPAKADLAVMGVRLLDPESLVERLGPDVRFREEEDGEVAHFYNRTGDEILTLAGQRTDAGITIRRVWITRVDKKGLILYPWLKEIDHFTTEKGIAVGMAPGEVKAILGEPGRRQREDGVSEEWIYHEENSPFLKFRRQTAYDGRYTFVDGRLKWFEFGFDLGGK